MNNFGVFLPIFLLLTVSSWGQSSANPTVDKVDLEFCSKINERHLDLKNQVREMGLQLNTTFVNYSNSSLRKINDGVLESRITKILQFKDKQEQQANLCLSQLKASNESEKFKDAIEWWDSYLTVDLYLLSNRISEVIGRAK